MNIVKKYPKARFSSDGFLLFDNSGFQDHSTIMIKITPNEDLKLMRYNIAQELLPHCSRVTGHDRDSKNDFKFYAALDIDMSRKLFKEINKEFKSHEFKHEDIKPELILYLDQTPIFAYLTGHDVTPTRPRNLYSDPKTNQKFTCPPPHTDESKRKGEIFVVSDMHFDHKNIIKYCNRPFSSVCDMNRTLIDNWNGSVRKGDRVYYLGDMTLGRKRSSIDFWLSKLNGEVRFIRGNHDLDPIMKAVVIEDRFPIKYGGYEFLLMHDPYRPPDWNGWIIHGDKHNTSPVEYPHINRRNKTVNVCVEYTGYTPMNLDVIIAKISECE